MRLLVPSGRAEPFIIGELEAPEFWCEGAVFRLTPGIAHVIGFATGLIDGAAQEAHAVFRLHMPRLAFDAATFNALALIRETVAH